MFTQGLSQTQERKEWTCVLGENVLASRSWKNEFARSRESSVDSLRQCILPGIVQYPAQRLPAVFQNNSLALWPKTMDVVQFAKLS